MAAKAAIAKAAYHQIKTAKLVQNVCTSFLRETFQSLGRGAPWGSRRDVGRVSRTHPHPSRLRRATFPLGGEGLRAADSRPYGLASFKAGGHMGPPLRLFDGIFNPGRAGLGPAPTADTEAVPHFVGNGPKPTRRSQTSRHLLGKARRGCGIASAAILEQPGPSGPD